MLEYRPRTPSELVDAAFALLRRDYPRVCLTMAVLTAPWLVVRLALRHLVQLDLSAAPTVKELGPVLVLGLAGMVWYGLVDAVLARLMADAYEDRPVEPAVALRGGIGRFVPVVLAQFLKYLAVGVYFFLGAIVGLLLGVGVFVLPRGGRAPSETAILMVTLLAMLPGVLLSLLPLARYAAVPATAALERNGPLAATRRSQALVKGRAMAALGVTVLVWAIYFATALALGFAGQALLPQTVAEIVSTIVAILVYPAVVAVNVALYYDLRIRKEGYDLELMASRLGPAATDAAPERDPLPHGA